MPKFLILYVAEKTALEQMAEGTPEQSQSGMEAWMAWAGKAGSAIVDFGNPVSDTSGASPAIGGFSILEADSQAALDALLVDHPHRQVGTIQTLEFLPLPGM